MAKSESLFPFSFGVSSTTSLDFSAAGFSSDMPFFDFFFFLPSAAASTFSSSLGRFVPASTGCSFWFPLCAGVSSDDFAASTFCIWAINDSDWGGLAMFALVPLASFAFGVFCWFCC